MREGDELSSRGEVTVLAERLGAPEGPVVGPDGWLLNVCSFDPEPSDWPTKGGDITATHRSEPVKTRTILNTSTSEVTGIPAALAFGPDGCLYATDEGRRSIIRISPTGEMDDLIAEWGGERLNGPNDLCFDEDGNLFFSDPWTSSLENPIGAIYGYSWATGELNRIRGGMAFPNGVAIREGRVYVAETHTRKVWAYEIEGPGLAGRETEFCTLPSVDTEGWQGPDGMAFDKEGNLFVAHLGSGCVRVYEPSGRLTESIRVRGTRPTNICFDGPLLDALCVTIDDLGTLVTLKPGTVGQRLNFCPTMIEDHPWSRFLQDASRKQSL